MEYAVRAESLGKRYAIGRQAEQDRKETFRDALTRSIRTWGQTAVRGSRRELTGSTGREETFWALRDVSFEIPRGEVVGIVGRNGAGKSTLLKILSRITEPSQGRVVIDGRVASLLEVGTGFHPELTGRENVFLNGAILGMRRAEIKRKFDEIVAFADIERFLDTPVKRYSSGMYVRLAFAVAAHLEPEILVVDEVLAVGDAEFQRKCLGKMRDVATGGRTVLLVSHNAGALASLCGSGILLSSGSLVQHGPIADVLRCYQEGEISATARTSTLKGGISVSIEAVSQSEKVDEEITFEIKLQVESRQLIKDLAILIYSDAGVRVAVADLRGPLNLPRHLDQGTYLISCAAYPIMLVDRTFDIGMFVATDDYSGDSLSLYQYTAVTQSRENVPYPTLHRGLVDLRARAELRGK